MQACALVFLLCGRIRSAIIWPVIGNQQKITITICRGKAGSIQTLRITGKTVQDIILRSDFSHQDAIIAKCGISTTIAGKTKKSGRTFSFRPNRTGDIEITIFSLIQAIALGHLITA